MRHIALLLAIISILVGCEVCEKDWAACIPPAVDDSESPPDEEAAPEPEPPAPPTEAPMPPERQISDASTSPTWHRNGSVFAEMTAMVSIEIICVDADDKFVFSADTRDYGWDELDGLELIEVGIIPYGQYPTAEYCYGLLSQNEQGTPDAEVPNPGNFEYPIEGIWYEATIVEEGEFEGWWKMTLHPAPPAEG